MKSLIVFLVLVSCATALGRTMDRCSLARELSKLGVARDQLARWTCIAERESSYRTHVVSPTNSNGSNDYDIFQINNYDWCQPDNGRFSYNGCKTSCSDLLTDDLTKSVRSAQKVLQQQGWNAWSVMHRCDGYLPSIHSCF